MRIKKNKHQTIARKTQVLAGYWGNAGTDGLDESASLTVKPSSNTQQRLTVHMNGYLENGEFEKTAEAWNQLAKAVPKILSNLPWFNAPNHQV